MLQSNTVANQNILSLAKPAYGYKPLNEAAVMKHEVKICSTTSQEDHFIYRAFFNATFM